MPDIDAIKGKKPLESNGSTGESSGNGKTILVVVGIVLIIGITLVAIQYERKAQRRNKQPDRTPDKSG